jgi:beta-glucosidase
VGRGIALEGRGKHNDYIFTHAGDTDDGFAITYYAPVINIVRDPRYASLSNASGKNVFGDAAPHSQSIIPTPRSWGRTRETFGEDVHLTSRLGVAFVRGIQETAPAGGPDNTTYLLGTAMAKVRHGVVLS